jgi:YebC/PmpR family DNA-binding regulatory protein
MSGHSKWSKIKRKKAANDAKKGAIFTKLGKNITLAAQEGGDPDLNFSLRIAIDKAKDANMPIDNIERAIKKGTGELAGGQMEKIIYEVVGLAGANYLIGCTTDNTNRTVSEVRKLVENQGFKLAETGSVSWQFKEQGLVEIGVAKLKKSEKHGVDDYFENASIDDLEMFLLELDGVLDYEVYDPADDEGFEETQKRPLDRKYVFLRTEKTALQDVVQALEKDSWQVLDSSLTHFTENKITMEGKDLEKHEKFQDDVLEHDDVDDIWSNVED